MGIITPLDSYIDGILYNGRIKPWFARGIGISAAGCPYRGTTVCTRCPLAPRVATLCDYQCSYIKRRKNLPGVRVDCEHRAYCPCGHDQTERLRMWGLVE